MLFYTYTAPGMFPGRLAGIATGIRPTVGGCAVDFTTYAGFRACVWLSDNPIRVSFVLVCPD